MPSGTDGTLPDYVEIAIVGAGFTGVSRGVASIEMDGKPLANYPNIPLTDDGGEHQVRVVLG